MRLPPSLKWRGCTDGRKVADDPALLQQGKSDIAACDANLDSGTPTVSARGCDAPRKDTCWFKGIRQRTCARHTLPLPNAVLPTDKITPGEPTSQARSVDFDRSFDDCRFAITDAALRLAAKMSQEQLGKSLGVTFRV